MVEASISNYACRVATLASNVLPGADGYDTDGGYFHMGALLSDSVLQAGVSYRTVVAPRVENVLERFPQAITTSSFLEILQRYGAREVLQWTHPEKPRRLCVLTSFLVNNCVFTRNAFQTWLYEESNTARLALLSGIGPKTIDYMKKLCGIDTVAVDRHVRSFVCRAGVPNLNYMFVKQVVEMAADLLGVPRSKLDYAIWKYESRTEG